MQLHRTPKVSQETGIRTILPKETLDRVLPLLPKAGMEPLEDITGVDNIGIPVYSISRPNASKGAVNNYNGKGPTPEQAMASAVMEAMERYSAEQRDSDEIVYGTIKEAMEVGPTVDPREMILPMRFLNYIDDGMIAWCLGYDLFRGERVWVPANAVYHPYFPDGDMQIFRYHTNGIAAGNTMEEAILHALLELVERDAWSIFEFREKGVPDIEVSEGTVCWNLIQKFKEGGVEIHLKDLTHDLGIPTIGAAADDVATKNPELLSIGVGTHLNPEIAAIRAITEVAQSRTTHKHGAKTNAKLQKINQDMGYERIKKANRIWFDDSSEKIRLDDMEHLDTEYVLDDIEVVLQRLADNGFDRVVAVDLTRDIGVPVVRMIVPGLEVYTMDPEREGPRLHGQWPLPSFEGDQ